MWFIFALLAGLFYTISGLLTRHVLKGKKDSWAFSFYFSFFGAITSLPFMLAEPKMPTTLGPWVLMFVVGILITTQNYFSFKANNHLSASVIGIVTKFRLVWVFLLSVIVFREDLIQPKLIGLVVTLLAGVILLANSSAIQKNIGIIYTLTATFFYAIVITLYHYLFTDFNSQTLTFFIFIFPVLINLVIMPNRFSRIKAIMVQYKTPLIIACVLGGAANLAMNYALATGDATKTLVTIEACLILTLIGESVILKEHQDLTRKIIATVFAVAGAVIMRLL
jgi:drug/metabolite transporter (DMT)-like permease